MNRCFISSSAAVFSKHFFINRTSSITFSTAISTSTTPSSFWKARISHVATAIKPISLNCTLTSRFRVQFLSTTTTLARGKQSRKKKKLDPNPEDSLMEEEKDAFYVVRKGDIVGVYKTLSDCQAQVGSSVCDPSVSVFKGYSLPYEAEEYLISRGLKNAIYTINAKDAKEDLCGALVPCPFQQPDLPTDKTSTKPSPSKRPQEALESASNLEVESLAPPDTMLRKHQKWDNSIMQQRNSNCLSCTLEFDGACKGNPGQSGAGAVLKADDESLVCRLREGVGIATNNVAEYRAVILGLRHALKKGFKRIRVQGDSKLVCMQIQGLWKTKNENMATLCKEAKELVKKFQSFQIIHVLREFNSDADSQANLALNLADGQVEEICEEK